MSDPRSENSDLGAPGWVKLSGLVVAVLGVLLAIVMFSGHGPGQHGLTGDSAPQRSQEDRAGPGAYQ